MAYAVLRDVLSAAPKLLLSATTKPSISDAEDFIAQINASVEGVLNSLGYVTPVTGPNSLAILKDIVVQGALAKILKAMFYGVRNPEEVGANDAWRDYTGKLKALADPNDPFVLPDAQIGLQAGKNTTSVTSSVIAEISDVLDEWRPTRDMVF